MCFSLFGKSNEGEAVFRVWDSVTHNVTEKPTAFLGCTVGHNPIVCENIASRIFVEAFTSLLSRVDNDPVRG